MIEMEVGDNDTVDVLREVFAADRGVASTVGAGRNSTRGDVRKVRKSAKYLVTAPERGHLENQDPLAFCRHCIPCACRSRA